MSVSVEFVFVCEGTSDHGLLRHFEELCLRCWESLGRDEGLSVSGDIPDFSYLSPPPAKTVEAQVRTALEMYPNADMVFVHRDADAVGYRKRCEHVLERFDSLNLQKLCVPVIPVTELEAWLLLDEDLIREVAENPNGRQVLGLPTASKVEGIADPKSRLKDALVAACKYKGKRLEKFKKSFPSHRRRLLELLDIDGALRDVPSWQKLEQSVEGALLQL